MRYFFSSQGLHLMVQKYSMQTKDLPRFSSKIVREFSRFLLSSYAMGIKRIVDSSLSDFLPINVHHMHGKNYFKNYFKDFLEIISTLCNLHSFRGLIHNDALRVRSSNVFNMTLCISLDVFISAHDFHEADFFLLRRELINYALNSHTAIFVFTNIFIFCFSHSLLLVAKSSNGNSKKESWSNPFL